jgi:hypothetical protein
MNKTRKRLVLTQQTVRDLTANDAATVVGGAATSICTLNICPTVRICPSRRCTLDPACPM